ncbi:hypothetical protein DQ04_23911000, partial [Trypanosoma grayi]|uniref:hypothetical protein n=1 Tax=Trypanosoma grayi TaxID=71804 RepID=UPI0004F47808
PKRLVTMTMSARHVPFVLAALLCGVCVAAAAEAGAESSSIAANVVGNEDKAATDALKKVVEVAKAAGVSATKAALLSRSAHASLSSSSTGLGEAFSAVEESTLSSKLDEAKEKTNKGKQAAELAKEATAAALEEAKKALASVAAAVQSVGKEVQWYKVGSGGMKDTNASDKAKELMAKAAATAQKALVKAKEMHTRFQQALSYGNTAVGLNNAAVEQATKADNEAQALKTNTDITTTLGSGDLKEKISSAQRIAI